MKPDRQVIKQVTLTLKHLAKDLRNGQVEAAKVSAYSKLLSDYNELIKLAQEDDSEPNYYDQMEQEAFHDMKSRQ
jgi:hypothetical protein